MSQADCTILQIASDETTLLSSDLTTTASPLYAMSDNSFNRPSSKATVQASTARYQSTTAPRTAGPNPSRKPLTFRPEIRHATTSSLPQTDTEHEHHSSESMADTSTRHAKTALELGQRNSPPKPSAWHESVHRDQLVRVWDTVCDVTARNPNYPKCITSQVGSTLNAMVKRCPELAQGKVPLTRDWVEYVLGKALRPPFCTAAMMGRWEILASSGGARSMWGPW